MSLGFSRLIKGLLVAGLIAAVVAAVAIPVAYRARRARWATELSNAARDRLAAGDAAEAARLYGLYLRESPDDAAAHAAYATLMRNQAELLGSGRRQKEAALNAISTAVRKNPDSLSLRRMLAISLLELGQVGTARQELVILREQAASASPEALAAAGIDLDEITVLEARTCIGNDNISDAAALAAGLTGFDPAGRAFDAGWKPGRFVVDASLLLAMILAEKREDPQAAERVLEKLTETAPDDSRSWLALARWHVGHGQPRRAADEIERAKAIAPDSREVLAMGYAMAMADGRLDEAARQADRIRELFPEVPDGGLGLAEVAVRRGQPEQALQPLQETLERLPGNPTVLMSLANAQLLAKRLDDAEQTIRGLQDRSERPNPAVGMLESRLLVARRQWLAAVKALEAVRPLVPESSEPKRQIDLLLAECHARLGQSDQQLAASQRVLSRDSNSLAARITAAAALAATGRPEKALAAYEAIAREIGSEQLMRQPNVWQPLLRLRGVHQLRLPPHDRDWSQVEQLLDSLEREQTVSPAQLAALRYDQLSLAGDPAAAEFLARAVEAHGDEPQLWERLVTSTLRREGLAAALRQLEKVPAAVVDDPRLLGLRARLAAKAPDDEANGILQGLESRAASLPAEQSLQLLATVASVRLGRGDQAGAERVWESIVAANPDDLPAHFALFELACEQRDLAKATKAADAVGRLCGLESANGRAVAAAKLLLEVAVGRSQTTAADKGQPTPAGKLSPEDAARIETAKNMLLEAEHERPGWPLLQRLLADLELLRGDVPAAIERLEKAVELSPENLQFIRPLVSLLAGSGRQPQARAMLRQIINATGDSIASDNVRIWARRTLAELAARDGNYRELEEAVAELARNQDRDGKPDVQDMAISIGVLAGRPEPAAWRQAIDLIASLADRRPLAPAERMQLAELLDRTGRWQECRQELMALAAKPDLPPAVLAVVVEKLMRHGELEAAEAQLKALAARQPTAAGVIALEARLAMMQGDRPAAVAAVRRLTAASTTGGQGSQQTLALASLLEEIGLDDEADTLLGQLADRSPGGVVARAEFLARRGRTSEALDMLQANRQRLGAASLLKAAVSVMRTADAEAAAEQTERVESWFAAAPRIGQDSQGLQMLQAELYAAQGRRDEAATLYKERLSRADLPPSQRVILQNNLAMQLVLPETAAEARRLIDAAIAEQGPHPSLLDTKGLALLAGGASREAVEVLREASLDRSAEKHLHLARALVAAGEQDEARQVLLEARSRGLDPRRLDADDRKRLEEVEAAVGGAASQPRS